MRIRHHTNPLSITHEHHFEGFGNDKPIVVDVGACKGEFSEALMEKFPEKNFILFEIRFPLAEKLKEKFKDCDNVVVFPGDAGLNFLNILQPCMNQGALVEEIYINFPDPWPKDKHKKRRFINTKFLEKMAPHFSPQTAWIFQTDFEPLFHDTVETVQASPFKQIEYFQESAHGIPTAWEAQKILEGDTIWRMKFFRSEV